MLESLIASYLPLINEDVVCEYAKKQGTELTREEARLITLFLKTHWRELYHQDRSCLELLRGKVREDTFQSICLLYEKMKQIYLQ